MFSTLPSRSGLLGHAHESSRSGRLTPLSHRSGTPPCVPAGSAWTGPVSWASCNSITLVIQPKPCYCYTLATLTVTEPVYFLYPERDKPDRLQRP
jgi:hypothetical protein